MQLGTLTLRLATVPVCLALAWLAISESAVGLVADTRPGLALSLRPSSPVAIESANQQSLQSMGPSAVSSTIALVADRFGRAPLDAPSLVTLARLSERAGQSDRAAALMELANAHTRRETAAQQWLYYRELHAARYGQAFAALDPLLRRRAVALPLIMADLDSALSAPEGRTAFVQVLVARPVWRSGVISSWVSATQDLAAAEDLFARLDRAGSPAGVPEKTALVSKLVNAGELQRAALLAGAQVDSLTDGEFKGSNVLPPFNWELTVDANAMAGLDIGSNGQHALVAEWQARRSASLASQLVALSPGRYRLSGLARVQGLANHGWVSWIATCASSNAPLAEVRIGRDMDWNPLNLNFEVPGDCGGVRLRLNAVGGDGGDLARAYYERFVLSRL